MKNEKEQLAPLGPNDFPKIIGDEKSQRYQSPHDMTEDVDPNFAGTYELLHGNIRVPVPDGKGGFIPRGLVYKPGAKMQLGALDAHRMLIERTVRRIDGLKPDSVSGLAPLAPVTETKDALT